MKILREQTKLLNYTIQTIYLYAPAWKTLEFYIWRSTKTFKSLHDTELKIKLLICMVF
jgi:hypothetical protein